MKRMALTLKKLEHALALQKWGSFSRASEELGLTQPTLSRSIASLEDIWGVQIFERGRSGVSPTPLGSEMLREAEQLVGFARTLDRNMQLRSNARTGTVAFGMSGLMSTVFMPDILAHLAKESPQLQVRTKIEPLSVLIEYMNSDMIEFAVYVEGDAPQDPAFTSEKLGEMPIDIIARSDHPLARSARLRWEDIRHYPVVCSSYLKMGQLDVTPTIICDNFSVAKDFMLGSDAIWLASRFVVRDELASGSACELRPANLPEHMNANIWITSPVNRLRSPAGRMVIDQLNKAYRAITADKGAAS